MLIFHYYQYLEDIALVRTFINRTFCLAVCATLTDSFGLATRCFLGIAIWAAFRTRQPTAYKWNATSQQAI